MTRRQDTRTLLSATDPSPQPWASDKEISATVFVPPDVYARSLVADDAPVTARTTPLPAAPVEEAAAEAPTEARRANPVADEARPSATLIWEPRVEVDGPRRLARMGTEVMAFSLPAQVAVPVTPERGPLPPRVAAVEPPSRPDGAGAPNRPDSSRVRSALDEMSMVLDVAMLPGRLANASADDVDRVLHALRRSEGLDVADAPLVVSGGAPSVALQAPAPQWPASPSWPAPSHAWTPAPPPAVGSWPAGPLPAASPVVMPDPARRSVSALAFAFAALLGLALGTGAALALFGHPHANPVTGRIEPRARAAASVVARASAETLALGVE